MSHSWYYAEGESPRGPVTLAELTSILSLTSQPGSVLVWHPDFSEWKRAEEIKEIAAVIFKPPPLAQERSTNSSHTSAAISTDSSAHAPAPLQENSKTDSADLKGIRGWLVVLAIGQILGLLRTFLSGVEYYSSIESGLWHSFPLTLIGEGLINAALAVLYIWTTGLFFKESKHFPRFFAYQVIAPPVLFVVNGLWVALTISTSSGQPISSIIGGVFAPREVGQTIAAVIAGGIWMLYLRKSKRAANTFVN